MRRAFYVRFLLLLVLLVGVTWSAQLFAVRRLKEDVAGRGAALAERGWLLRPPMSLAPPVGQAAIREARDRDRSLAKARSLRIDAIQQATRAGDQTSAVELIAEAFTSAPRDGWLKTAEFRAQLSHERDVLVLIGQLVERGRLDPAALHERLSPVLARAVDWERIARSMSTQLSSGLVQDGFLPAPVAGRPLAVFDNLHHLRVLQVDLDVLESAWRFDAPGQTDADLIEREYYGRILAPLGNGAARIEIAQIEHDGIFARRSLEFTRVALALMAHRQGTGEWPADFGDGSKWLGGPLPLDPATRLPIAVALSGDGRQLSLPDQPNMIARLPERMEWPEAFRLPPELRAGR